MSNGTRKQWMFFAACGTVMVLINLWISNMNATTSRIIEERGKEAERRLEEAINEKRKREAERYVPQAINERSLD